MNTKPEKQILEAMHQNPDNWKLGLFYYNKKDLRILVPKANPYCGWTLNFASPYSYLLFVSIILIAIVCNYFLA